MKDINCPYCGHGQDVCHDDGFGYAEDEAHEMECYECEKMFVFNTMISFNYEANRADCLNGGSHSWEPIPTSPSQYAKMRCGNCGEKRMPTADEMKSICVGGIINTLDNEE